jgi:hypothetical protein
MLLRSRRLFPRAIGAEENSSSLPEPGLEGAAGTPLHLAAGIDELVASPWIGLHHKHEFLLHHKHESLEPAPNSVATQTESITCLMLQSVQKLRNS